MLKKNTARLFAGSFSLPLPPPVAPPSPQAETPQGSGTAAASASTTVLGVNEAARALLPAEIREAGVLRIASDPTYPPFEFYDTDNKTLIGWDADMGDAIGAVLGLKVEHVPATFDTILPGLASGKYDLGMSTFSVTEERRKAVDFVPYLQGGTGLAVAPGNPEKLSVEAQSLCGKAIAAQKGSIQSLDILPAFSKKCTEAGNTAIDMQFFPTQNDANLALTSGRVQGVMADSVSLAYQGELAGREVRGRRRPGLRARTDRHGAGQEDRAAAGHPGRHHRGARIPGLRRRSTPSGGCRPAPRSPRPTSC